MTTFIIRFVLCNVFISIIIVLLSLIKRLFKNIFSNRMQYNIWYILFGLLIIPFLPINQFYNFSSILWINNLKHSKLSNYITHTNPSQLIAQNSTANWMNDFTVSVKQTTPPILAIILLSIWIIGMLVMLVILTNSILQLINIKNASLPLQNKEVYQIYKQCKKELAVSKDIPIYSCAFLSSPIIVGLIKPGIYLPIHLISDYNATDIRFMLLHELQHYKHKDSLTNYFANIAGILYWFNPFVWYAIKQMRYDREIACDTSVLDILFEYEHEHYGVTLINFAKRLSHNPFFLATGINGNISQIKRRIINISQYHTPSLLQRILGTATFIFTAVVLFYTAPTLSTSSYDNNHYSWNSSSRNIVNKDFSSFFKDYIGCFVLYDSNANTWTINNMEHATTRISPDSTYKIYIGLHGLEKNIISPSHSLIRWNNKIYPINAWNKNHNLHTAMNSSVNWYFQSIDKELNKSNITTFLNQINYGNKYTYGDISSYWLESSLKISPIEQVELITKLYNNAFNFKQHNINAIKDSIFITSSRNKKLYGKTGTGRVNEKDINGWFIGYVETSNNTYFFATNIKANTNATGSNAAQITMSILSNMNIW